MDRLNCPMINMCGKTAYCGYYGFMEEECFNNPNCIEEMDDDELDDDDDISDFDDDFYDTNDTHI